MAKDIDTRALMLFLNQRPVLEALKCADLGRLVLALMEYMDSGKVPEFTGALRIAFVVLQGDVDRSMQRWEEECRRRSEAGKKGAAARNGKNFTQEVSCERDIGLPSPVPDPATQEDAELSSAEQRQAELSRAEQTPAAPAYTYSNSNTNSNSNSNSNTLPPSYPPEGTERAFEQFWQAYPKKVGKRAAREAFAQTDAPLEQLLAGIVQQRGSPQWKRENGRYIPNPASWLNRRCWEDELPPGEVQHHGAPLDAFAQAAVRRMIVEEM